MLAGTLAEIERAAIEYALSQAAPDDLVVIAGKGHECEQIVGNAGVGFVFGIFHVIWTIVFVPTIIFAAMSGNPWLIVPVI